MRAIIKSGSKQYNVAKGDLIDVDLLDAENTVTFSEVLFYDDGTTQTVGKPVIENFSVTGEIIGEIKGPKVIAYKYKKRKNYRRKVGHRQRYLRVKITDIITGEKS